MKNKLKILVIIVAVGLLAISLSGYIMREDLSDSYRVLTNKCIGCEACVAACPEEAISIQGGKAIIDQTKCIQCEICVYGDEDSYIGCPVGAILAPEEE